jgi:thymidylate synthase
MTALFAHLTGYKPGELVLSVGNTHVYLNHLEALEEQLKRTPTEFPTLKIREGLSDLDKASVTDFVIEGYKPQGTIKMAMAV